ncbi:MAG: o-succinylbenzoate synthase [Gammaproteobacteria bacterium]
MSTKTYRAAWQKRTLHFKTPAGTSRGWLTRRDCYFIRLSAAAGDAAGIGECSPLPGLSIDDLGCFESELDRLCADVDDYLFDPEGKLARYPALRFGLECAKRSLDCKAPWLLFPSAFTAGEKSVPINGLLWMGSSESLRRQFGEKIERGFTCIKLKIGAANFEDELALIREIRKAYGPEQIEIRVDANGAFDNRDVLQKLEALAELSVHSIEQPIAPGNETLLADICATSRLAVALDEELIGRRSGEIADLLAFVKPAYIVSKPTLLGGFVYSQAWIDHAEALGIGWWVTSALESNVGLNAIAQWTAMFDTSRPQGLGTGRLFEDNIPSPLYLAGNRLEFDPTFCAYDAAS